MLDFLDENKRIIWRKLLRREISYIEGIKYKEKAREYRKKWYQKNKKEYLKKLKERREMLKNVDKDKADKLKKMLLKRFSVN